MSVDLKYRDNPAQFIRQVYVEECCKDHPYSREILARLNLPVQVVADRHKPMEMAEGYANDLTVGKQNLYLCRNRGKFLKACPATREYVCCDYQVLNVGMNCPMDCVYCILQAYLNNPWLSFYVNIEDLFVELEEAFHADPSRFWRIGTGEFTDSLALDSLTFLSSKLVSFMKDRNGVLELKTKTAAIANLKNLDHGSRTVTAWSLNSPVVMAREELRSASLEQRLEAAALAASWGYRLAFHFDPILYYTGWQKDYAATIDRLFAAVPADKIAWISMGALRFLPSLKKIVLQRFPRSTFFHEEFIAGLDGKFRYFRTRRVELYRFLYEKICRYVSSDTCVYLCMESDEIWRDVFGFIPAARGGLPEMLDRAAREK